MKKRDKIIYTITLGASLAGLYINISQSNIPAIVWNIVAIVWILHSLLLEWVTSKFEELLTEQFDLIKFQGGLIDGLIDKYYNENTVTSNEGGLESGAERDTQ